jgi:hypothetical protein
MPHEAIRPEEKLQSMIVSAFHETKRLDMEATQAEIVAVALRQAAKEKLQTYNELLQGYVEAYCSSKLLEW